MLRAKIVNIRPAIPDDSQILSHLQYEYRVILSQSDPRFAAVIQQQTDWTTLIQDNTRAVLVGLVDSGNIAGYIHGHVEASTGIMDEMVLDAHQYHGGLGRLLWKHLNIWFRTQGATSHHIFIPRYHPVEQAFWRALGAEDLQKEVSCPPEMTTLTL